MGRLDDLIAQSHITPDQRLLNALEKKLTILELHLLEMWVKNERDMAALAEWNKHKDRIPPGY